MTRRWKDIEKKRWVTAYPSDTDSDRGRYSKYIAVAFSPQAARSVILTNANARRLALYLLSMAGPGRHPDMWVSVEAHGDCPGSGTWGVMLHHQYIGSTKSATLSLNEWRSDCLPQAKVEARAYAERLGIEFREQTTKPK